MDNSNAADSIQSCRLPTRRVVIADTTRYDCHRDTSYLPSRHVVSGNVCQVWLTTEACCVASPIERKSAKKQGFITQKASFQE